MVVTLMERAEVGRGYITNPGDSGVRMVRTLHDDSPRLPTLLAAREAAQLGSRILGGALLLSGTVNDPRRVTRR